VTRPFQGRQAHFARLGRRSDDLVDSNQFHRASSFTDANNSTADDPYARSRSRDTRCPRRINPEVQVFPSFPVPIPLQGRAQLSQTHPAKRPTIDDGTCLRFLAQLTAAYLRYPPPLIINFDESNWYRGMAGDETVAERGCECVNQFVDGDPKANFSFSPQSQRTVETYRLFSSPSGRPSAVTNSLATTINTNSTFGIRSPDGPLSR
jgi:hypothetical protein